VLVVLYNCMANVHQRRRARLARIRAEAAQAVQEAVQEAVEEEVEEVEEVPPPKKKSSKKSLFGKKTKKSK